VFTVDVCQLVESYLTDIILYVDPKAGVISLTKCVMKGLVG
jgi:hypothetical protein